MIKYGNKTRYNRSRYLELTRSEWSFSIIHSPIILLQHHVVVRLRIPSCSFAAWHTRTTWTMALVTSIQYLNFVIADLGIFCPIVPHLNMICDFLLLSLGKRQLPLASFQLCHPNLRLGYTGILYTTLKSLWLRDVKSPQFSLNHVV